MRRLSVAGLTLAILVATLWFVYTRTLVQPAVAVPVGALTPKVVLVERGDVRSVVVLKGIVLGLPEAYRAVAVVDPALLYRFYDRPVSILVKIDKGPAPFDCPFLSTGLATGSAPPADLGSAGPVYVSCRIPKGVRVFAGIPCLVAVTTAVANNVLLVPVTAVEGGADVGFVTLIDSSGKQLRRQVQLGVSDGTRIQVISGVSEGDRILDLPPSLFPSDSPYGTGASTG
jgi:hypothetical protein